MTILDIHGNIVDKHHPTKEGKSSERSDLSTRHFKGLVSNNHLYQITNRLETFDESENREIEELAQTIKTSDKYYMRKNKFIEEFLTNVEELLSYPFEENKFYKFFSVVKLDDVLHWFKEKIKYHPHVTMVDQITKITIKINKSIAIFVPFNAGLSDEVAEFGKTSMKYMKLFVKQGKEFEDALINYKYISTYEESLVTNLLKFPIDLMKPEVEARAEKSEYICYDGILQQMARKNENGDIISRQYVAAPSESGKSTYLSKLVQEYKMLKPKSKIYLFSDTPRDPVLDRLGVIRIKLDEELIEDPIEAEELAGNEESDFHSLVILDDIDSIINKKIFKQVAALRDQLLQKGRHHKISVICTNHKLADYKNTSIILNESQFITLFPKATCLKNFSYILKTYCGMSEEEIKRAYKLPTRWVTILTTFPRYVLYQSGVYLL